MYRDNGQIITHDDHRFILYHAALGDMITSLPAIIHARKTVVPDVVMHVYVPSYQMDLVRVLLEPYGHFVIGNIVDVPLSRADREKAWPNASVSMNTALKNSHTRNRVHMVDYAFNFLIDARPESMSQRNYPNAAPLGYRQIPDRYVVVPVGATSDNKLFKAKVMQPVLEWLLENHYLPVLVGTKMSQVRAELGDKLSEPLVIRDEIDKLPSALVAQCDDWREKTTLLELRDILGHADAVVGVDGGTLHLAGTTDVPIVYAMGTTLPKHRYIPRGGDHNHKIRYVGPRNLECTGCQSNWQLTRLDFRFCAYGDNKCMDLLHPEDFINGLKELGL
jgi:ADP-heptose:LPS heptosyltransferase